MSHVVVLGAGIIGITTAYYAQKAGHRVTVIERNVHATPKGTPINNLFLNAGHGALGWTLSCGCAKLVSDLLSGKPPGVALEGLTLAN